MAALALAGLVACLFRDILFRGHALYYRDIHLGGYGQVETFVRCIATGSWPVWDPYLGFGRPLLANPATQALYPWTWLNLLFMPWVSYTLYVVSHLLLSGLGLHALGRRLGLSARAALAAGAVWVTSGPLLSLVNLWQHFAGAAWLPWVLLAADSALLAPSPTRVLLWGAAVAGQVLTGSVDMCAITGVLTVGLVLCRLLPFRDPLNLRRLGAAAGAILLALGLSAAQWLPALELLESSRRLGFDDPTRMMWSLHPASLFQLVLPIFPQDLPLLASVRTALFDGREPLLGSMYLGLAALPLVSAAWTGRSRRLAALLYGIFVLFTLAALGKHAPVYGWFIQAFPVFGIFRFPSKATIVLALVWALLAGLGFDAWREEGTAARRSRLAMAALGATGAGLALLGFLACRLGAERLGPLFLSRGPTPFAELLAPIGLRLLLAATLGAAAAILAFRRPDRAGAAVAALAVLDLFLAHDALNPTMDATLLARPPATLQAIDRQGPTRIFTYDYATAPAGRELRRPRLENGFSSSPANGLPPSLGKALGLEMYLQYAVASRWGLSSGYWHDVLGLSSRPLYSLNLLFRFSEETPDFLRLLRLGSVSYVLALHTEGLEDLGPPVVVVDSTFSYPIRVFRVPGTLPRAYVVGRARFADGLQSYKALVDPGFDPAREIVLPGGPQLEAPAAGHAGFSGSARLVSYLPDRVRIDVETSAPGYVVLVDAYDPGWRATVDGREVPLLRANVAFRAVPVAAGRHEVALVYRPRSVEIGFGVSAATLVLGLVGAGLVRVRRAAPLA